MDLSRNLITRIVDDENLSKAQRSGITADFLNEDSGGVFRYIERYFSQYKSVPSRDGVLKAHPNFVFLETAEPLEYVIDELKESRRRNILEDKIDELSKVYTKDSQAAEILLREALSELHVTQKTFRDVDAAKTATDRFLRYEEREKNPGVDGITSGWSKLDNETLGWHAEEFIVLVGEKYMGKSWKMIYMAMASALAGERVLFITPEMSQEQVMRRFDALYARVCFDSLRRGELTVIEKQRLKEKMAELSNSNLHFIVARQGVTTIQDIENKAAETDATIAFGDSIYLLNPDHSGKRYNNETHRLREVSQTCKRTATAMGIPFIVSLQAGRRQSKERVPTLDDIEWSNSFSQDADTVFFVHKDEVDRELHRSHMTLLKCRDGNLTDFFVHQDYQTMDFSQREDESEPTTNVFSTEEEELLYGSD